MGYNTAIEWTDHTFNPWWGCTRVSAGCDFCYAEAWASRFNHNVWGAGQPRRTMGDTYWRQPLAWNAEAQRANRRPRVFCASMADVFDPEGPEAERERLWELIRSTPYLDWQLLTKRPELLRRYLPEDWGAGYPNVWLGTSVENDQVLRRIDRLTRVPAIVHFLSLEPLIGPLSNLPLNDIEWVIVGGESGSTPRPIETPWVRDIHAQCQASRVAFFFKQWGGTNKRALGRALDGEEYSELPTVELPGNWPPVEEERQTPLPRRRGGTIVTR